jgi:release factor glutamine methyltransferase
MADRADHGEPREARPNDRKDGPAELAFRTIGSALDGVSRKLAGAGFEARRRLARQLVATALELSPAEVFAYPEREITAEEQVRIGAILSRMIAHEPLSRIIGTREFWGLEFLLSADTLDPRPDSETVVEAVLKNLPERGRPYRLLDLGTGTGCLLLALLSELQEADGVGVDIAFGAAKTARRNAERLGLGARAWFAVGDWAQPLAGPFDVIVANPPYIPAGEIAALPLEVKDHDPRRALDGGTDGLAAYHAIAAELPRLLAPGGLFATEIGWDQADAVAGILSGAGLTVAGTAADLAGITRCILARP